MDLRTGRATPEGTANFHARTRAAAAGPPRHGPGGLHLSSVGIGTYLGSESDDDDALYIAAVGRALELGLNVVDTAVNYRSQRSERDIGAALATALGRGGLAREEVLVASKAGYLPFDGTRPRDARAYFERTYLSTGIVPPGELAAGCHCMAPRYLDDQLERSRANLGLATVDVYYLHNPETQFDDVDRAGFLARARGAFGALEAAAQDGRIGVYGAATWNGFRRPPTAPGHLSLAELVGAAREVGGPDHHFRVVQLPYNLAMPEAFAAPTQLVDGHACTLVEAAERLGVYVMTSASLLQGQLAERLPDEIRGALGLASDAERALQFARSTPGIGTALCGMKREKHVEEAAAVERVAPASRETIARIFDENA
jgi:aryl-alcohol dehydrogenase-like predicted oxidoreductase